MPFTTYGVGIYAQARWGITLEIALSGRLWRIPSAPELFAALSVATAAYLAQFAGMPIQGPATRRRSRGGSGFSAARRRASAARAAARRRGSRRGRTSCGRNRAAAPANSLQRRLVGDVVAPPRCRRRARRRTGSTAAIGVARLHAGLGVAAVVEHDDRQVGRALRRRSSRARPAPSASRRRR